MESIVKLDLKPEQVREFNMTSACDEKVLDTFGVTIYESVYKQAMDALTPTLTTASTMTPVQFLQYIMPDPVRIVTADRAIDRILGRKIVGEWHDEEIVTPFVEGTSNTRPYGDTTTSPYANFNINFEKRTVVRMESGIEVDQLEEARGSRFKINVAEEKRKAATLGMAIEMNRIGFNGFNNGANATYGLLNDPNLPNYVAVAVGAGGFTTWATKTFLEIVADIKTAFQALRTSSGNLINPQDVKTRLVVASAVYEELGVVSQFGNSVMDWINKTYPKCEVSSAIEFDGANGGANVFYLFAEELDGQKVIDQYVVQTFRLLGIARREKGYSEAYTNASAGVMLRIPAGLVRYTGV